MSKNRNQHSILRGRYNIGLFLKSNLKTGNVKLSKVNKTKIQKSMGPKSIEKSLFFRQ